jgi:hypothetical protein
MHNLSARKPEERTLAIPRCRWEDNVKIHLKEAQQEGVG